MTQRKVWTAPDVASHSFVVLTLPRLYLTPAAGAPKPEMVSMVESALDLELALGPLCTIIDLSSIQRVQLDLLANSLSIDYRPFRASKLRTDIIFSSAELADAAFGKLWRRLGSDFALRPQDDDPWTLARAPLVFMAALLAGTGVLALTLNALTDFAASDQWLISRLLPNWRVICGLGGAGVAAAQIWLYRRLTLPPERLELIRS